MDIRERAIVPDGNANRHPWELARAEFIGRIFRDNIPAAPDPEATVLDIGCGDAFMAETLARNYPDLLFLSVDQALDKKAIADLDTRISLPNLKLYQNISQVSHRNGLVKAVLLLDVLEHIPDDVKFLKEISSNPLIAHNALCIITVPAFPFLYSMHDSFLGHYRRYDLRRLYETVQQSNMCVNENGYFFTSLLLLRMVQISFEKLGIHRVKQQTGIACWQGGAWLTQIMKRLLVFDGLLNYSLRKGNIRVPGLSCYIVCKKQEL